MKKIVLWCALITVIFYSVVFGLLHPAYETNDDVFMMLIARGSYTGTPSPYLIFMHVIPGLILNFLYRSFSSAPWYSIWLYSVQAFSLLVILVCISARVKSQMVRVISIGVVLAFYLRFALFLQYTTVATGAATAGVLLLCLLMDNTFHQKRRLLLYIVVWFLWAVSFLIRDQAYYLVITISIGYSIYTALRAGAYKEKSIYFFIGSFILFALIAKALTFQYYYQNPQWHKFMEFHRWANQFHGYSLYDYDDNTEVYRNLSFSKNDYSMLVRWFYHDASVFTTEKMRGIIQGVQEKRVEGERVRQTLIAVLQVIGSNLIFISIAVAPLIFLRSIPRNAQRIWIIILPVFVVCIYFSYLGWLPQRVFLPMILWCSLVAMVHTAPLKGGLSISRRLLSVVVFFIFLIYVILTGAHSQENAKNIQKFKQFITKLPRNTLILEQGFTYEWVSVFDNGEGLHPPYAFLGGWILRTPLYNDVLNKYRISSLYQALYEGKVSFIAPELLGSVLKKFMKEHYSVELVLTPQHTYYLREKLYLFNILKQ